MAKTAVQKDPFALFTDFQWYLFKAQNTVYFSACLTETLDSESLITTVANMVTLAPQLTHGFEGALPGQPLPRKQLEAITSITEVDSFDGYPDKWQDNGLEIFDHKDLPLFRVTALVRRGGPDAQGRASMILVRSSHSLMEGSDSAMLTRSLHSSHDGVATVKKAKVPFLHKLKFQSIAALTSPLHLLMAHIKSPKVKPMGFSSAVLERQKLRRVANQLGVGQRALMFSLVMYALNNNGEGIDDTLIKTAYTTLDGDRHESDDDFFRVRTIMADFDVDKDFVGFCKGVEKRISEVESKDTRQMQFVLNATFKTHRFMSRFLPFLYTQRFFRYGGDMGLVLTMVPPHRVYGDLTRGMMEPIFCGSFHPGTNLCTFVPGRKFVTINFAMEKRHLPGADVVYKLLNELDGKTETAK